jgi:hypothetical protein
MESPSGITAIGVGGGATGIAATAEPKNPEDPKSKTPPSDATNRDPVPAAFDSMPTIGLLSARLPVDPAKEALKEKMPPSDATSQ